MKQATNDGLAWAIAIIGGIVLWLATMAIGGKREAWDSGLYWSVAYPLAIVLAAWLGYRFSERPWRWALAIMLAQALTLAATAASFGLLPLGMIVFSILALPLIAAAVLAARLRRRRKIRDS